MHHLSDFYTIKTQGHREYLNKFIPAKRSSYNTRNSDHIETYRILRNSISFNSFKNSLLKIGRLVLKLIFNFSNPFELKLLTRLRIRLSCLNVSPAVPQLCKN